MFDHHAFLASCCGLFLLVTLPLGCKRQGEPETSKPSVARTTAVGGVSVPALGEATYNEYCISCHGALGDGKGPASLNPYVRPRDFTDANWQRGATDERLREVIVKGGAEMGLSSFMPPWQPLLSDEKVTAVIAKVRSFAAGQDLVEEQPVTGGRGRQHLLYDRYCVACHGPAGGGDGRSASALDAKPRNFTDHAWQTQTSDERIKRVIVEGGVVNALSSEMPAWGNLFTEEELKRLVATIRGFDDKR